MTTVLLTGFEPFAGDAANPSGEAVRAVGATWDGDQTLVTEVLPVTFAGAATRMRELIAAHSPDVVIATGLAGGRGAVTPERVAVNLVDARIPDNDGARPVDVPSVAGAENALFSTLPVKAVTAALDRSGIRASVSYTAGTFVCNHVFFTVLEATAAQPGVRAGFIHVPWATGQAPSGQPELPLETIAEALRIAVRTTLTVDGDLSAAGGALH